MIWTTPDRPPEIDTEVQVLCEVLPPSDPQDGFYRACNMPISSGDHAEGDRFVSIGFLAEFGGDKAEWQVAGWDMSQDCWTDARRFKVLGWCPLNPIPPEQPST